MADDRDHADADPGVLNHPRDCPNGLDCACYDQPWTEPDLGLPYKPHSRQVQGRRTEKMVIKDLGARLHPNSGSGRIKEDGSDATTLYEVKDAGKTHTLSSKDLETSWIRAARQDKDSVWIIKFGNGITATIHLTKEARDV